MTCKVRMVLEHKGLAFDALDGLHQSNRDRLEAVNGRVEVPALDHDGLVIVGSADIVAYLERVFAQRPVYPSSPPDWVRARAWERCADTVIDPILIDISFWTWAKREDSQPPGMREAAQRDLDRIYEALEQELDGRPHVCGQLSIADIALFPHLVAARPLGVGIDESRFPRLVEWLARMRDLRICRADLLRTKQYLAGMQQDDTGIERTRIFWRGDRIEWVLARGFHDWFLKEIEDERVLWPGLGVPAPRVA